MKMHLIQFSNNFYNAVNADKNEPFGEYCVLGYFDAVNIFDIDSDKYKEYKIWHAIADITIDNLQATCTQRNVLCVTDDEIKDKLFWEDVKSKPIIIISLIRLKEPYKPDTLADIKCRPGVMLYFTSAHSDLIMMTSGSRFSDCKRRVMQYREDFSILKMYSVLAIREDSLNTGETIEDERVDCRLRIMVQHKDDISGFLEEIAEKLGIRKDDIPEPNDILGGSDVLVELNGISIRKLLREYKMGRHMTHPFYRDKFYNIETEIVKAGD